MRRADSRIQTTLTQLIAPEELAVDYYVTSHLHFDHFDYDAIPIVAQCTKRTLFFGPASCQEKFIELGIQAHRCHRLDRGECYQDEKILIRAVMADHGTMAPDAIGLLVAFAGHRLYFSGDHGVSLGVVSGDQDL